MIPNKLTIRLPVPANILSPNKSIGSRGMRIAKANAIRELRQEAAEEAQVAVAKMDDWEEAGFPWQVAIVMVKWVAPRSNWIPDELNINYFLKAAFDGLQDAGVITDDFGLVSLPCERLSDPKDPHVLMTVFRSSQEHISAITEGFTHGVP